MTDNIHARLESRNGDQAVFDGVRVDGQVAGMLLDVSSVQTFRNPGTKHIELVYTFPLPADAVLLSVGVRLGERHLTGKVVEKQEASGRYEDMLAEGDTAIMLERATDGSYCLNFGNLGPGETGEITLRYAQTLRFEGDALRVCIPTVIAPRYGDPVRDAGLAPHQAPAHDLFVQYPFALALQLGPALAGATVASPSHKIAMRATDTGVSVVLSGDATLDRDFVLTLAGLAGASSAIAAPDPVAPGQAAVLAGFRPRFADTAARPIRVKILVDCSGSMAGDSIAASRKALQAMVAGFGEGDRFLLSRFGDTVEHRNRHLLKMTEVTRLSAARWIGDLEANLGGTEMEAALASTFALDGAAPSDVLLVTDGHIHAIDSVIKAARGALHRLFIVAIGSAASEGHLRRLARATGGAVDFVAPGEGVEPAIRRMFARLRSPRLGDLRLAWTSGRSVRWASLPDAVFSGDTVHVYALVEGEATGDELRLYGCDGEGAEHEIGVAAVTATPDDGALARMAIHARLHEGAPLGTAQRTQFACDYGLVTAHTNFLLTLERAAGDKAQAMPELQRVAQMLPAGWGGAGSVVGSGIPKQVAVWRRESVSDQVRAMQANGVEHYDIPAFLRKAGDDLRYSMPIDRRRKSLGQRMAEWWWGAEDGGSAGASGCMAPLALHEMLASTPHTLWDTTYGDMLASGIDRAVVDWLCVTFGTTWPEHVVVVSFMACMAQPQMRDTLVEEAAPSWRTAFKPASWKRKAPAPALPPEADAQVVARIAAALVGITAQAWPPAVLATPAGAPAVSASKDSHGLAA
jgi:Ca-activated chloride channel family protein